jgi:hypothetical protein
LILLATRVRGLGILWRILAAIPLLIMGAYAGYWWYFLSDPQKFLTADGNDNVGDQILQGIATALQNVGVYSFSAGAGLILLTAAVIVGILAIFLPSRKSQRYIPASGAGPVGFDPTGANPQQYPPQQYPPQQYPDR